MPALEQYHPLVCICFRCSICIGSIGQNEIVTASALSLIAGLGDLPPTALAGIFLHKLYEEICKCIKKCLVPALAILIYGLIFVIFAGPIASIIFNRKVI